MQSDFFVITKQCRAFSLPLHMKSNNGNNIYLKKQGTTEFHLIYAM